MHTTNQGRLGFTFKGKCYEIATFVRILLCSARGRGLEPFEKPSTSAMFGHSIALVILFAALCRAEAITNRALDLECKNAGPELYAVTIGWDNSTATEQDIENSPPVAIYAKINKLHEPQVDYRFYVEDSSSVDFAVSLTPHELKLAELEIVVRNPVNQLVLARGSYSMKLLCQGPPVL